MTGLLPKKEENAGGQSKYNPEGSRQKLEPLLTRLPGGAVGAELPCRPPGAHQTAGGPWPAGSHRSWWQTPASQLPPAPTLPKYWLGEGGSSSTTLSLGRTWAQGPPSSPLTCQNQVAGRPQNQARENRIKKEKVGSGCLPRASPPCALPCTCRAQSSPGR